MLTNRDYIRKFVLKHDYKQDMIHVQCLDSLSIDNIQTVVFNKEDIPSERKIPIDDIIYDIESELPKDVFFRYLEYIDKNDYVTYIYWMTKMDNKYEPMGMDKSESERVKKILYDAVEQIRNKTWI